LHLVFSMHFKPHPGRQPARTEGSARGVPFRRCSFFAALVFLYAAIAGSTAHAQIVTATVTVGSSPKAIAVNPVTNTI